MNTLLSFSWSNKAIWVTSILLVTVLLTMYIIQINLITGSAYTISGLEQQLRTLKDTNKDLEATYMQATQFRNLDELASTMGFEKIGLVSYIKVIDTAVAQNFPE